MSPEGRRALSPLWKLNDVLQSSYHAAALATVVISLVAWNLRQEYALKTLQDIEVHGTRALSDRAAALDARISEEVLQINMTNARLAAWEMTFRKVDVLEAHNEEMFRRIDALERRLK